SSKERDADGKRRAPTAGCRGSRSPQGKYKKMGRVARRDTNYRIPMTLPPNPMGGLTADIVAALHVSRPRGQSNLMPAGIRKPRLIGGTGASALALTDRRGGLGECLSTYRFNLRSTWIVPASKRLSSQQGHGGNTRYSLGVE